MNTNTIMTEFPSNIPEAGEFFRHTDGGLYVFLVAARHSEDQSPLFVYNHVWPFEKGAWARPAAEWEGRFTAISHTELLAALEGDRLAAQAAVTAAKAARRAGKVS